LAVWAQNRDVLRECARQYANDPVAFINDWVDTYDPRNAAKGALVRMPFRLFKRQKELVQFFHGCLEAEANAIVEKSRDMGATWAACSYAMWLWLFRPGASSWQARTQSRACEFGPAHR
jgi:phage terminase large subunit